MPVSIMKSTRSPSTEMEQLRQDRCEIYGSNEVSYGARDIDPGLIPSIYYFFPFTLLFEIENFPVFIAIRCQRSVYRDRVMGVCNKMFKLGMRCCPFIQLGCKNLLLADRGKISGTGIRSILTFPFQTSLLPVVTVLLFPKNHREKPEQKIFSLNPRNFWLTPFLIKCRR